MECGDERAPINATEVVTVAMTNPDGNGISSQSSTASKKDAWEVLESISRIIAALGIPVVLGVGGWIIQGTVSQQTVSKDYVLLATDILKTKREAGEDGDLRKWAVDLLNRTSPVPLDEATAQQLIKGTITIPSSILRQIGSTPILAIDSAIIFESGMVIDSDGAYRAFHPDNKSGLEPLGDAGYPGNWWGLVTDNGLPSGNPVIQTGNDPAPGFYVSPTVLQDSNRERTDPRRYVNSEAVNYIVIPGHLSVKVNNQVAKLGDFAVVIRPEVQTPAYAVVADIGPQNRIGEGSIALAKALEIPSDPRTGGISNNDKGVLYIVFPGSAQGWPLSQQEIDREGAALFSKWGGIDKAKMSFPQLVWR
jgi:hypothetical protein